MNTTEQLVPIGAEEYREPVMRVRIRHWLIRKLAGDRPVVLNVWLDTIPAQPWTCVEIRDCVEGCFADSIFSPPAGKAFRIRPAAKWSL